jgi:exportin-2 (importin alpha re-exporter)
LTCVPFLVNRSSPTNTKRLLQQLVSSLSPTAYNVNVGVLETAHSIFLPWRSQVRTDTLFTTINFVLSRFVTPFLQLLRSTAQLLLSPQGGSNPDAANAMKALVEIYYDLTCQDLPPDIEDSHLEFWGAENGILLKFLGWEPAELRGDVCLLFCFALDDDWVLTRYRTARRRDTIDAVAHPNGDP